MVGESQGLVVNSGAIRNAVRTKAISFIDCREREGLIASPLMYIYFKGTP